MNSSPNLISCYIKNQKSLGEKEYTFNKAFQSLYEDKNKAFLEHLKKKKKKNINFLFISETTSDQTLSDWNLLLANYKPLPDKSKHVIGINKIIDEEFKILKPLADLESLSDELKYLKHKEDKKVIQKLMKNIQYIRRAKSFQSFYNALSYGYLEQILIEDKPFKILLGLLQKLKNPTFELINPFMQNLADSYSDKTKVLNQYMIDNLIKISQEMFLEWERKKPEKFQSTILRKYEEIMKNDKIFQLMAITIVKSLVQEHCILNEHDSKDYDNLMGNNESIKFKNIKIVSKALNVKIEVLGYKLDKYESFEKIHNIYGKKLKEDFTITLYYGDGCWNLGYDEKFCRFAFGMDI